MRKNRETLLVFILFGILELLFWYCALLPGKTLFLRDLSMEIIPKRYFWANTHGWLWTPYGFFGMPYAANPQSEAFYPFTFFFRLFRVERGLVYYIVFHHLLFLSTLYLALRKLGFGLETGLICAIGFSFGGFMCSLTMLIVLLSTIAWFPIIIILLSGALEKNWMRLGLLAAVPVALQVLAGEIEIAALSWLLALMAVALGPRASGRKGLWKIPAALALGLIFGAALSAFQLALTLQMIPLSNRAGGFFLQEALEWSFWAPQIKSIFIPNYIISPSCFGTGNGHFWGLGFFSDFSYFLSFYVGIALVVLAWWAFAGRHKPQSLFWIGFGLFSLAMTMGEQLPLYNFFFWLIPGFKLMRLPVKFYFLFNFSLLMLAGFGFEALSPKRRTIPAVIFLALAVLLGLYLVLLPLDLNKFGDQYELARNQFFLRSIVKTLFFLFASLGIIFFSRAQNKFRAGILLALLCWLDLFQAHRYFNPAADQKIYQGDFTIRHFVNENRGRSFPARVLPLSKNEKSWTLGPLTDPLVKYTTMVNGLESMMPIFFGIDGYRAYSSFHIEDILNFNELIYKQGHRGRRVLLARAGVEYVFYRDRGFVPLIGTFPRASIYYHAMGVNKSLARDLWPDANFTAAQTLLLEGASVESATNRTIEWSEPAKIISYENEKVAVEANARKSGWLLLLDTYYPGWKATVDGKPAPIYRADGFFRAVPVSAGRHLITFHYFPGFFWKSIVFSGICLLLLVALVVITGRERPHSSKG